ncbi:MAG: sensor histidine kinase [Actinomycetota bacterium]|nr:sensor histidine kinase [Actinomycetota bacterium]
MALLETTPLAWRRRAPLIVSFIVFPAVLVEAFLVDMVGLGPFSMLICLYTLAAYSERRRLALLMGITTALVLDAPLPRDFSLYNVLTLAIVLGFFISAWVLGYQVRLRREYAGALADRAARLEAEQEAKARQAVAEERVRIARELHDVVAHSVSLIALQAGAARLTSGPGQTYDALATIESKSREALAEMRRLLGVLRTQDEGVLAFAPQPSMDRLDALIEQTRAAGLNVAFTVEGQQRSLSPGLDLSAYRIVQEALTNVLKHAGQTRAVVAVRYGANDLEVEVVDEGNEGPVATPRSDGAGQGLVGMRERVLLFGGELDVGSRPGGGYAVRARLPLDSVT